MPVITFAVCFGAQTAETFGGDLTAPAVELQKHAGTQPSYYWEVVPVGTSAQLITLHCRGCFGDVDSDVADVPLVSALRDTLTGNLPEDDRLSYLWLLTYKEPNIGRKLLSAVPFFYWRVGEGSSASNDDGMKPLLDLTAPESPMMNSLGRNVLQWALFDVTNTPVRATTRAYRGNALDHERLHLEEAIGYLKGAPVGDRASGLTQIELDTAVARLELRKTVLGGLVSEKRAAQLGAERMQEYERVRVRNWELLRQWAEKTGLHFEPLQLGGTSGRYVLLSIPLSGGGPPQGTQLRSFWKLLNLKNPWGGHDSETPNRSVLSQRSSDERLRPLGLYSLDYPKQPLLLVDFRDMSHLRRHEMIQRGVTEVTSGVIGISHFTNWYYYAGAMFYDFVESRHGSALDRARRLDSYSEFRVRLALDTELNASLREEVKRRADNLAANPLETSPKTEVQGASKNYILLQRQAQNGSLLALLDKSRRMELAQATESHSQLVSDALLHTMTLGTYTKLAPRREENDLHLADYRRLRFQLNFLDKALEAETPPEVAYGSKSIRDSVQQVQILVSRVSSRPLRGRTIAVLHRLESLTKDGGVYLDCTDTLASLRKSPLTGTGIVAEPRAIGPRMPIMTNPGP